MGEIEQYLISIIPSHSKNAIKLAMEKFRITRMAVHRHMNKLKAKGIIEQIGLRNKATYHLVKISQITSSDLELQFAYQIDEKDESEIWAQDIKPALGKLPINIEKICQHGFTEMYNNVIDHSENKIAKIQIIKNRSNIKIVIIDFGIGIYKKVADACKFDDYREAIIKIHQGKFTTDRFRHSGEGIFFTSRVFEQFTIIANGFLYHKDNSKINDWYFERCHEKETVGTTISMSIFLDSNKQLKNVFDQYVNSENFKFDKTQIRISLGKFEEDGFVSRSQAKRLLNGLTGFEDIMFDFSSVKSVGQAFVDEVFGVYGPTHPTIQFQIENANTDVTFMIKRCIANRENLPNKIIFLPI